MSITPTIAAGIQDPLVHDVARTIADGLKPDRILLFGSRAHGTAQPDSDIDLLVLYSGPLSRREAQLAIRRLFPRPTFSMDVFVMSPDDWERQKPIANTLAREVAETGVVCYG